MRKEALAAGTIAAGLILGAVVWLTATPALLADG
jgi:type IV secretory pathway TrbD component